MSLACPFMHVPGMSSMSLRVRMPMICPWHVQYSMSLHVCPWYVPGTSHGRKERDGALAEMEAQGTQREAERAELRARIRDLETQLGAKERQLQDVSEQVRICWLPALSRVSTLPVAELHGCDIGEWLPLVTRVAWVNQCHEPVT